LSTGDEKRTSEQSTANPIGLSELQEEGGGIRKEKRGSESERERG